MKTAHKARLQEQSSTSIFALHYARRSGVRAGAAVVACAAALGLSACSASQAESNSDPAESAETSQAAAQPASPSAPASAGASDLAEPLAPQIEVDGVSPSGWRVLSEQGTGAGTHLVKGGLEAGQVLTLSASCTPGDSVIISTRGASYEIDCDSPGTSSFFEAPASEAVSDIEVTVETAAGSPYWLAGWVHDAQ